MTMAESLSDTLTAAVQPDHVAAAANALGVPGPQAARGLTMGVTAIGAGLASKLGDTTFVRRVYDIAAGSPAGETGFLASLFGNRVSSVGGAIADATGGRPETGTALLGLAAPIVFGALGSHIVANGLSPAAFLTWLNGQKDNLVNGAPPLVRNAMGFGDRMPTLPEPPANVPFGPRSSLRWAVPLALVLLVTGALWSIARRAGNSVRSTADTVAGDVTSATKTVAANVDTTAAAAVESAGALYIERRLPTGTTLRVRNDGTESKLLAYLDANPAPGEVNDTVWFEFDRLLFDKGATTLTPASEPQLRDVAAILTAYPTVHATIGGYTDNTGNPSHNMSLSQGRATSVVTELISIGVPAERLTAKGYGDAHPVADNATADGRARNRRIALRVTQR
jgi:OmpA-OmpF porin, OOP family